MGKGIKMSLADFNSAPATTSSWADDVEEDLPQAPAAAKIEYDYKTSETGRQGARPASRDVPSHPPFIAFLGQLSYDTQPEQIDQYFHLQDIIRDTEGRSKGFAYVTFVTQQALREALMLDNGIIDGRAVRIDVGESGGSEERATNVSDSISDWRAKGTPGQVSAFGQQREQREQRSTGGFGGFAERGEKKEYVSQNASYLALQRDVPTERTRIVPAARTAPPKVIQVEVEALKRQDSNATLIVEEEKVKFNPFGAAKPRDEAEIARASAERQVEREEREKLAKEAKRVEEVRVRALALAEKAASPRVATIATEDVEKKIAALTVADTQSNWRARPKSVTVTVIPEPAADATPRYQAKRTSTSIYEPKDTVKTDRMSKFGGGREKEVRPVYLKKEVVKVAAANAFDVLGDC